MAGRLSSTFWKNVPGVNEPSVKQQLANLKSSGDYARIIGEVRDEIEREHREALKELERVERERQKAEEAERKAEEERKAAAARAKAARETADRKRAEEAQRRDVACKDHTHPLVRITFKPPDEVSPAADPAAEGGPLPLFAACRRLQPIKPPRPLGALVG